VEALFGPDWLRDKHQEGGATEGVLETLQTHLEQYQGWLGTSAPLHRLLKHVLRALVMAYLTRYLQAPPKVTDAMLKQLETDRTSLSALFLEYVGPGDAHLEQQTRHELAVLELIGEVAQADMDTISVTFKKVVHRFQRGALEVMRGLVMAREDLSRQQKKGVLDAFADAMPAELREVNPVKAGSGSPPKIPSHRRDKSSLSGRIQSTKSMWQAMKAKGHQKVKSLSTVASARMGSFSSSMGPADEEEAMNLNDFLS
jgi:hypothetical protein